MDTAQAAKLKKAVEAIENIDEQRRELGQEKSEIMRQAIDEGFDRKAIKRVLAERRLKPDDAKALDDLVDEYKLALGMTPFETIIEKSKEDEAGTKGRASRKASMTGVPLN